MLLHGLQARNGLDDRPGLSVGCWTRGGPRPGSPAPGPTDNSHQPARQPTDFHFLHGVIFFQQAKGIRKKVIFFSDPFHIVGLLLYHQFD